MRAITAHGELVISFNYIKMYSNKESHRENLETFKYVIAKSLQRMMFKIVKIEEDDDPKYPQFVRMLFYVITDFPISAYSEEDAEFRLKDFIERRELSLKFSHVKIISQKLVIDNVLEDFEPIWMKLQKKK